ncbi:FAD:protein FMN transferase [Nitratireductor mangrovi]|uniref:FAD:protein FMN transferase n=1 Tax=Nitratireductor mangrovi TaxID=2599600 RepID=A0A5B8L0M1_9HYPH|nr:FAD:protein FMN transferase [Nitratireductor mangrovi]QDZ01547.1 FAD:protein FMN transferase [Nitratireductor mangrovi]
MRFTRRAFLAGAGSSALGGPLSAASGSKTIEGPAFGSTWRAVIEPAHDPIRMRAALQAVIASVDAAMSPFRTDSEITRFNTSDSTDWYALSKPTCDVIAQALDTAKATAGAFDPTVGGIVGQYGFGPIARRSKGNHTGISQRTGAVRKVLPDLTLDLCGIAKGHALDRMIVEIETSGAKDFIVEVGGEVSARGRHPSGRPWRAGIENPETGGSTFQRVVMLNGEALATSGDRVNSYVSNGRRYSHLVDPHRRRPADSRLASVSVLAPTATRADAMATALYAMGHEAGPEFAETLGLPAVFLVRDRAGIREISTGSFAARILA